MPAPRRSGSTLLAIVIGGAFSAAGCSSATPSSAPAPTDSASTSTAAAAAPTNDELLHPFDGTWRKRFVPVACALEVYPTGTVAPGAGSPWNQNLSCAADTQTPKGVFYYTAGLTIDGSTITVDLLGGHTCTGAMHAQSTTPDGSTTVLIDHVACDATPAPDVTATLRVAGDVIFADGDRIVRKGADDPDDKGASPTSTFAPAVSAVS